MRFIAIYRPDKNTAPTPENIAQMGAFIEEATRAGVLLATEGFGPSTGDDARLRLSNGTFSVTDGPFAETKEVIAGFAIMQAAQKPEILEWCRRFLAIAGDGESEIRTLSEMSPIEALAAVRGCQ